MGTGREPVFRRVLALLLGLALLAPATAATAAPGRPGGPRFTAGAPGVGDPYFPYAGNGGYDVQHYDLDLTYTPPEPDPAPPTGRSRTTRPACGN